LIDDLLRIAQIDASGFLLKRRKYDLHRLIKEVIRDLEPTISQTNQKIVTRGLDSPAALMLDATEMKVAIANIIENASKYSPAKSTINISSHKTMKQVVITVKDHGMGIAKKNLNKIFDKFSRLNSKPYDTVSGTGLGLYLVKQTIELHGGSVTVKSTPGKGSEFKITLPL
jgi:signal transduction histidine kinase